MCPQTAFFMGLEGTLHIKPLCNMDWPRSFFCVCELSSLPVEVNENFFYFFSMTSVEEKFFERFF